MGLTINLLNLRVKTKMLDYNFIIYIKMRSVMVDVLCGGIGETQPYKEVEMKETHTGSNPVTASKNYLSRWEWSINNPLKFQVNYIVRMGEPR